MDDKELEFYDYMKLDFQEQHHLVLNQGRFLQFRWNSGRIHALYALGVFFVNLEYSLRRIEKITPFRGGHLLNLHSESLQI